MNLRHPDANPIRNVYLVELHRSPKAVVQQTHVKAEAPGEAVRGSYTPISLGLRTNCPFFVPT